MKGVYSTIEEKKAIMISRHGAEDALAKDGRIRARCPHCDAPIAIPLTSLEALEAESQLYYCTRTLLGKKGCGKDFYLKVGNAIEILAASGRAREEVKKTEHEAIRAMGVDPNCDMAKRLRERFGTPHYPSGEGACLQNKYSGVQFPHAAPLVPEWIKKAFVVDDSDIFVVAVDDLINYKPACSGAINQAVIDFLKQKGISEVYINGRMADREIYAMIINIGQKDAAVLTKLQGSDPFRPDVCGRRGWSYYESE